QPLAQQSSRRTSALHMGRFAPSTPARRLNRVEIKPSVPWCQNTAYFMACISTSHAKRIGFPQ
ncbi:MAG TPA: hypothetical protein VKR31_05590, partial [Rhizomicrobium sp.]|nr:hypothetical protein [Rhizomicrobium sp.]